MTYPDCEHIDADEMIAAYPQQALAGRDAARRWIETVNPSIHEIRYVAGLDWTGESLPKSIVPFLPESMRLYEGATFFIAFSRYCDEVAEPQPA